MLIPSSMRPLDGRFGAGPSRIPAAHLHLDATWMGTSHRAQPVKSIVADIRNMIGTLFDLPEGYEVALGNGGASLLWDAIGLCLVEDRAQAASFGAFSGKAATAISAQPQLSTPSIRSAEPGDGIECAPEEGIDTYLYPHNETSTGVMLPVRRLPALTVVDGTSAAGAVDFDISAVDVYYFSPQKALAADGGLWLAILSPEAIARSEELTAKRWVPDLLNLTKALEASRKDQTVNTPALATLNLLYTQLRRMLAEGGLAEMDRRARDNSQIIYDWAEATAWAHPFARREYRSQTVVTLDVDLPAEKIVEICRQSGIVDISGYRALRRNQLRIATFPQIRPQDLRALAESLTWVGQQLGPQ